MDNPTVFQVIFPGEDSQSPTKLAQLGLWKPVLPREPYRTDSEQPGMVWRADLPAGDEAAALVLYGHDLVLLQTSRALAAAGPLLERDLSQAAGLRLPKTIYALPPDALPSKRNFLAQAINAQASNVSFSLKDDLVSTGEIINRFAGQVSRLVDQFTMVESIHGGQRIALTRVEWLGDMHTWWTPGGSKATIAYHRRVLAQALATRQAWLRLVLVFTASVAKVSLAMAAAPFNPLAVWAAWNYINKVIEEYRSLRQVMQTEQ